jgi:hypothetical protein
MPEMNNPRAQEEALFDAAQRFTDPAQRKAFLDAACAKDLALRRRLEIPIAAGEHLYHLDAFRTLLDARAVDVLILDLARVGGVTPWRKIAALAQAHRVAIGDNVTQPGIVDRLEQNRRRRRAVADGRCARGWLDFGSLAL